MGNPKYDYSDSYTAENYEKSRFGSLKGRLFARLQRRSILCMLRRVEPASLILDMPCGTGRLTGAISSTCQRVIGGDASQAMLQIAAVRHTECLNSAGICRLDADRMPFGDNSFDAIICIKLFHLYNEDHIRRLLLELQRTTKKYLIVSLACESSWSWPKRSLKRLLGSSASLPVNPLRIREAIQAFHDAGFKIVSRRSTLIFYSHEVIFLAQKEHSRSSIATSEALPHIIT
jgi:ubiquinone/menaquinone biosynthesis C-methylase UbiE